MGISAPAVAAEIYRLLGESIDPLERRKQIEQLIHDALHGTMRSFESRIAALEEVAHTPFDFTGLIERIEAMERGGDHEKRMAEAEARIVSGACTSKHGFKLKDDARG
ncbi:MAG: hypothetical protein EOS73_28675 [Mesorhizobium sp.]|uniref:hypothetical protein n=1 Tax=Mesorhizobium sp. M7A.F.Ca.ET.027.02.1.1 TaxID=2496655 RepID=UPI000FD3B0E9|nr:hypothetical protein [Mesorhizobium sp. M7A.F.Ca.ET.027.02.1.1]RVD13947.1 hypothetical protein EN749_21595 [Mesorhizobium sp. M7A.F.Ca.ET.027.02.1.1]RWC99176.1 MAG: hypothetical protein EOS73_28675 [Mesorhizobium sp.]